MTNKTADKNNIVFVADFVLLFREGFYTIDPSTHGLVPVYGIFLTTNCKSENISLTFLGYYVR